MSSRSRQKRRRLGHGASSTGRPQSRPAAGLAEGMRCHKAGDLQGAERHYRRVLSRDPGNGEALNLLGVIAVQTGRPTQAAGLIGRAVQADSGRADFHYNLGMAYLGLRSRDQAINCFRQATKLRPDYADALVNLGNLLLNAGELEEAEACYKKAVKQVPRNAMVHNNLGTVLMAKEATQEAEPHFRRALRLKPDYAEAHNGLGSALYARGQFEEALANFKDALRCKPDYAEACYNLGNVCFEEDLLEDAETYLRKAVELKPDHTKARLRLAQALIELDDYEPALEIYESFLASDPEWGRAWAGKANVLDRMGRSPEAYDIVRKFAEEGPPPLGMVHLYANLAGKERRQAEVAAELEGMLAQTDPAEEDGRMLCFTLGRLYDELGRFDEAFAHYEAGNRSRPAPFDAAKIRDRVDRMMAFFAAERLAELPRADNRSEQPVFIVGMPRSGTSLVEQILSCHRDVHAAGELRDIGKLVASLGLRFQGEDDVLPGLDSESLNAAAGRHLERLRGLGGNAKRLTDKMPYNFLHLGLISLLFPRARVIHCLRDPIDTCLSCYFQNFATGNFFSFDLAHAGLYYRQYERLMAHWKAVLDKPILEVRYEEHVAEPEKVCREMLDFLDLDWDPACLRFHESRRFTNTASRDQVRKPIYTSSSGRWQRYERHLGPLLEALAEADRRG